MIQFKTSPTGEEAGFPNLNMGLWTVRRKALFKYDPIYDDPFFVVGNTCVDYPDGSEFDTKWESARALSITSWLLSGLATVFICAGCCTLTFQNKGKILGGFFLMITTFQGLTLLVLKSANCTAEDNSVFLKFPGLRQYYADSCTMSRGAHMNIAATVFYFLAAVMLFKMRTQYVRYDEGETIAASGELHIEEKDLEELDQEKEMEEQPVEGEPKADEEEGK
jgi:hypothetical protein